MIKTGETITVEAIALEEKNLRDIRTLEHVFDVQYEKTGAGRALYRCEA